MDKNQVLSTLNKKIDLLIINHKTKTSLYKQLTKEHKHILLNK